MPDSHSWLDHATWVEDRDARKVGEYSWFITKLDAIQLATRALQPDEDDIHLVIDEYCDREHLYGAARREVSELVMTEHEWIVEFFFGP